MNSERKLASNRLRARFATHQQDSILVGLHIPRCGGTSILRALHDSLPHGRVCQSTNLFANYRNGQLDFHLMPSVAVGEQLALWGHWVHEQMLPRLTMFKRVFLFTVIREPIERAISELLFRESVADRLGLPFDREQYLTELRDPMCNMIVDRFPSLAVAHESIAARAVACAEWFDFLFTIEVQDPIEELISWFCGRRCTIGRENRTTPGPIAQDLKVRLAGQLDADRVLYEYALARARTQTSDSVISASVARTVERASMVNADWNRYRAIMSRAIREEFDAYGVRTSAIEQRSELIRALAYEVGELAVGARDS